MSIGNRLTLAQIERLVKLQEELNEAGKEVCKILLHGFEAEYAGVTYDNRSALEKELGDVCAAINLLTIKADLSYPMIVAASAVKDTTITKYMSYQDE